MGHEASSRTTHQLGRAQDFGRDTIFARHGQFPPPQADEVLDPVLSPGRTQDYCGLSHKGWYSGGRAAVRDTGDPADGELEARSTVECRHVCQLRRRVSGLYVALLAPFTRCLFHHLHILILIHSFVFPQRLMLMRADQG